VSTDNLLEETLTVIDSHGRVTHTFQRGQLLELLRQRPPNGDGSHHGGSPISEVGADELVKSETRLEDLPYLPLLGAAGYLVRGWSHIFAGYPRIGKTELVLANIREWLDIGLRILYITEEPRAMWEPRLAGRTGNWSGLRIVFGLGSNVDALLSRARDGVEDIVIVDALRNLLQLKDENDNSEIARAVNPWIADQRETGKTLFMVHHDRKGGGEHGEGIAGGHAILGSFDIAIEVLRDPNQATNRRLIRTYARLIESQEAVYEKAQPQFQPLHPSVGTLGFRLLGDPKALRLEDVASRLLASLTGEPQTTKELHAGLADPQPSLEQVRQALLKLAHEHKIRRQPPIEAGEQRGKSHSWAILSSNEPSLGLEVRL